MARSTRERMDLIMRCYGYQHAWDPHWPKDLPIPMTGYASAARCLRCEAKRIFMLDWEGKTIARRYFLHEDYRVAIRGITRGEARIWLERRHNRSRAARYFNQRSAS